TQLVPSPFAIAKQPASLFGEFAGSGENGDIAFVSDVTLGSITRVQFANFTIPSGVTVKTGNKRLLLGVQGTLTIAGVLSSVGQGQPGGTNSNSGSNAFPGSVFTNQPVPGCCSGAGGGG